MGTTGIDTRQKFPPSSVQADRVTETFKIRTLQPSKLPSSSVPTTPCIVLYGISRPRIMIINWRESCLEGKSMIFHELEIFGFDHTC